ncbi:MAG: hypothetical protein ABJA71_03795 [Ginsengibacter sp.]
MLRFLFILFIQAAIITGCNEKKIPPLQQQANQNNNNFFPVTQYLLGQLNELDSLPVTPLKITSINGNTDSVWLKKKEIRSFVQPFLNPVIDSSRWSKYFTEKSFLDQTINAFTFSYDPIKQLPDSTELKRWDVYVDPATSMVKRIYIVKQLNSMPSQTIQLTWKQGHYCKITTITEKPGLPPQIKEEQLIWNFNE